MNPGMCNSLSSIPRTQCLLKLHQIVQARYNSTNRSPEAVFVTKSLEHPALFIPKQQQVDFIGPPNAISNLRPIVRHQHTHETALQRRLRELQDETQDWNQQFWSEHNLKFVKEKEAFIQSKLKPGEERTLSADEMSEFYKKFLDNNWRKHVEYNFKWYKRNLGLLLLSLRVNCSSFHQNF